MTTFTHVAASILLVEAAQRVGVPLTTLDTVVILAAGNLMDIDYLINLISGKRGDSHHAQPTHTPLAALALGGFFWLTVGVNRPWEVTALILGSLFLHLLLDDLCYWFNQAGLQDHSPYHQINWLWPLRDFHQEHSVIRTKLSDHAKLAPVTVVTEALIIGAAIISQVL